MFRQSLMCLLSVRRRSHEEYGTWPRGSVSSFIESGKVGEGVMWLHWYSMFKAYGVMLRLGNKHQHRVNCWFKKRKGILAVSGKLDFWARGLNSKLEKKWPSCLNFFVTEQNWPGVLCLCSVLSSQVVASQLICTVWVWKSKVLAVQRGQLKRLMWVD